MTGGREGRMARRSEGSAGALAIDRRTDGKRAARLPLPSLLVAACRGMSIAMLGCNAPIAVR